MKKLLVFSILICTPLFISCLNLNANMSIASEVLPAINLAPPKKPIDKELFGINLIGLQWGVTWPTIPFHGWRNFHSYWDVLEPNQGKWNFEMLDREIALASKNGVESMLVLGSTPTWASSRPHEKGCCTQSAAKGNIAEARNLQDWRTYIKTIALRYKGKVHYYELWNEPNHAKFFSGTIKKLVELNREAYIVLKEVDPTNIVVSSSVSIGGMNYLDEYLSEGGGKYADVIGYHFYVAPKPPETFLASIKQVKELMQKHGVANKPLWNTETGWNIINHDVNNVTEKWAGPPLSDSESMAYIARSYILSWAAGVDRFYWYSWGHRSMGMTEYDVTNPKPIAKAFKEIQSWLIGSQMVTLNSDTNGTFICLLKRANGENQWIVWNSNRKLIFSIPIEWKISRFRNLNGNESQIIGTNRITIDQTPILLER